MSAYLVIPVMVAAAAALLWLGRWTSRRGGAGLVRTAEVDRQLLYQPLSVVVAVVTVLLAAVLSDDPWAYLAAGDLRAPVTGLGWLGVGAAETWLTIGLTIGAIITGVTALVVVLQARRSGSLRLGMIPWALAVSLPFAAVNAAVEEAIFRLAPATSLGGVASMTTVALVSAVIFGVPHYLGHPGRVPGVLLAGFLGWLTCLSVLQTHGLLWAWSIHFVQDVVILTVLFAVSAAVPATALAAGPSAERPEEPASV